MQLCEEARIEVDQQDVKVGCCIEIHVFGLDGGQLPSILSMRLVLLHCTCSLGDLSHYATGSCAHLCRVVPWRNPACHQRHAAGFAGPDVELGDQTQFEQYVSGVFAIG
eukprot:TRINITY_DN12262_c0_g1_i1.p4 TRINITY_DN12262_c0_g1~~TRINITY_DN12262_c0_g1_i1.p4  ORF type:complete len:109 (+),score=7.35 TRINITY_DN12262_c0_g1_i1:145-471(+)